MARKKTICKKPGIEISQELREYFATGAISGEVIMAGDEIKKTWKAIQDGFLAEWIQKKPGSRPWVWWRWDAPEPRLRLGGVGTPEHEILAVAPFYEYGIPASWVSKFQEEYYNGRARDIHGNLIECQWKEGDFAGKTIDPRDPPRYESQATYLRRLKLFLPNEQKKLRKKNFAPENVIDVDD